MGADETESEPQAADDLADRLREVREFEATRNDTPVTWLLKKLAPTRGFASVYAKVGPAIDPWILSRSEGKFVSRVYGLPALLLHTVGRRSGAARVSPLLYVRDGTDFVVVGSNFGRDNHPAWTENLLANPDAEIQVGPVRMCVRARLADDTAWARLWPRLVEAYPGYDAYLRRAGNRKPRIFLLRPDR
jgi:deazaflavin-dependent oxidoreductase (nitroreductase family)